MNSDNQQIIAGNSTESMSLINRMISFNNFGFARKLLVLGFVLAFIHEFVRWIIRRNNEKG